MSTEPKQVDYQYSQDDATIKISVDVTFPKASAPQEVFITSEEYKPGRLPYSEALEAQGSPTEVDEEKEKQTWSNTYEKSVLTGLGVGDKILIFALPVQAQEAVQVGFVKIEEEPPLAPLEGLEFSTPLAEVSKTSDLTGFKGEISAAPVGDQPGALPATFSIKAIPAEIVAKARQEQFSEDYLKGYNVYRFTSQDERDDLISNDESKVQKAKRKYKINSELIPYYTDTFKDPRDFTTINPAGFLVNDADETWYTDIFVDRNLPKIPPGGRTFYYVVTAVDDTGNESEISDFAIDVGPEAKEGGIGIFVSRDKTPPVPPSKIDFDTSIQNAIGLYWEDYVSTVSVTNVFATYDRVTSSISVVWDVNQQDEQSLSENLITKLKENEELNLLEAGIGRVFRKPLFLLGSYDNSSLYEEVSDPKQTGFDSFVSFESALADVCRNAGIVHPAFLHGLAEASGFNAAFTNENDGPVKGNEKLKRLGIMKLNPQRDDFNDVVEGVLSVFAVERGLEHFNNGVVEQYKIKTFDPNGHEKGTIAKGPDGYSSYLANPYFSFAVAAYYIWHIKASDADLKKRDYTKDAITKEETDKVITLYETLMNMKEGESSNG